MSDYEKMNCAKPTGYKVPQPFDSGSALEEFYRTLDQNRTLREQCAVQYEDHYVAGPERRDIYVQMEDTATALQASPFYTNASDDLKEEIEHQTEDRLNGIDPSHCILRVATMVGLLGTTATLAPVAKDLYFPNARFYDVVLRRIPVFTRFFFFDTSPLSIYVREAVRTAAKRVIIGAVITYVSLGIADGIQHASSVRLDDIPHPLGPDEYITPEGLRIKAPECKNASFGKNIALDQQCFGMTRFDSCGGRRCSDYKY